MFLSFVVPVYNVEKYIQECLDSLLDQDIPREDYEIICVNDGSTDGSLEILHDYEKTHTNIRVIDQKNSGVCAARNTGLRSAKGNYIWYFDSDDIIQRNSLGLLRNIAQDNNWDRIIVGQKCFVDSDQERVIKDQAPWFDSVVSRSLLRRDFLLEHDLHFRYPDLRYGEDALMVYEIKRCMPSVVHIENTLYFYRIRQGSAVNASDIEGIRRRVRSNITEAEIMKEYHEKKDGILPEETANRFMSFLWCALGAILVMPPKESRPYLQELRQKGLYPYPTPSECTLKKYPEIKRNDLLGKILDLFYTNLSTCWGYHGMRLIQHLIRLKQRITK